MEILTPKLPKYRPLCMCFHCHSAQASLDGGSSVKALVKRSKELGRKSATLTDHGQMGGLAELYEESMKAGIIPIHGVEAYLMSPWEPPKIYKNGKEEPATCHMTVLFKTQKAYEYFSSLTPIAHDRALIKYGDMKPLITWEELQEIGSEIVLGSGCYGSAVSKALKSGNPELAEQIYQKIRAIVNPESFFVEVMPHILDQKWIKPEYDKVSKEIIKSGKFVPNDLDECGVPIDLQKATNQFMIKMARKYKDPIVISEDAHIAVKEHKVVQDVRLGDNWRFSCSYSLESSDTWAEALLKQLPEINSRDVEEWVDNSYKIFEQFKDYKFATSKTRHLLPTMESVYNVSTESSSVQHLKKLIVENGRFPKEPEKVAIYADRLKEEIRVLTQLGYDFLPYIFTVHDVCNAMRERGYLANPRGSGCSSLVLYLIGISIIDPIEWKLPFSRFLNEGRVKGGSFPDIDLDISVREVCLDYLKAKYQDKMALISTDVAMRLKLTIREVERWMFGKVRSSTEDVLDDMPFVPQGVSDMHFLFGYEDESTGEHVQGFLETGTQAAERLKKYIEEEKDIWEVVLACSGIPKARGVHAGGVVITPVPIQSVIPITKVNDQLATAYTMKWVEYVGGVKFDFLGVKTLESLSYSFEAIKKNLGINFEWKQPPHDERVFTDVIHQNKISGIFQISGGSVAPFIQKAPPRNVKDLAALIALCRPGALDAPAPDGSILTAADYYVECVNNRKHPYYVHPELEPILSETYGVLVYQEQLMAIAKLVLGLNDQQADDWRRATGKKDKKLMDSLCEDLKQAAIKRGWNEEQAQRLVNTIIASARYSFNCLSANTLVKTSMGIYPLGAIVKDYKNFKVLTVCPDGTTKYQQVSYGQFMGRKKVVSVVTENGAFTSTLCHRFMSNGQWMTLEQIINNNLPLDIADGKQSSYSIVPLENEIDVYDIEVPETHNFVLANGVIAHNCSHAASYGVIAYIEAMIKCYYPAYYWLGKLTVNRGKEEKILAFLSECREYVLQPSVLHSHSHEWIVEGDKIRAPLAMIKGVGVEAAKAVGDFIKEHVDMSNPEHQWGSFLLALADSKKVKARINFTATTVINLLYAGAFKEILPSQTDTPKDIIIHAAQLRDAMNSKSTGGKLKRTQTVSLSMIEDEFTLSLWRAENNPIYSYSVAMLQEIQKMVTDKFGFIEGDSEDNILFTRPIEFKPTDAKNTEGGVKTPRMDIVQSWTKVVESAESARRYITYGNEPRILAGVIGIITNVETKTSKNGNPYLSFTLDTGTDKITGINVFGSSVDKYKEHLQTKKIVMVLLVPKLWNGKYFPDVKRIVPLMELKL